VLFCALFESTSRGGADIYGSAVDVRRNCEELWCGGCEDRHVRLADRHGTACRRDDSQPESKNPHQGLLLSKNGPTSITDKKGSAIQP
jgi:hypothetical protein